MRSRLVACLVALLASFALVACSGEDVTGGGGDGGDGGGGNGDGGGGGPFSLGGPDTDPPETGACRVLKPEDVAAASNDTDTVECAEKHNAETFHVSEFTGGEAESLEYDDPRLGALVFRECQRRYLRFVGATPSLALRSVIDWAWWRPGEDAWDEGARWFRCDVVGGTDESAELVTLPETAKGLLLGIPPSRWMLCANGAQVADAPKVPCSEPHNWRAVSAVVVGKPKDKWPGARVVEVNTRDYCSDWVGAWLNYPLDYEYGYTWFGRAEWESGNRQSVCWAKTDE